MATVVAFNAHPDDEVLLTGGTLARLATEGHRVIIVTAFGSPEARAECLGCGAIDFLEKPLDAGALQSRIQLLLAGDGR